MGRIDNINEEDQGTWIYFDPPICFAILNLFQDSGIKLTLQLQPLSPLSSSPSFSFFLFLLNLSSSFTACCQCPPHCSLLLVLAASSKLLFLSSNNFFPRNSQSHQVSFATSLCSPLKSQYIRYNKMYFRPRSHVNRF